MVCLHPGSDFVCFLKIDDQFEVYLSGEWKFKRTERIKGPKYGFAIASPLLVMSSPFLVSHRQIGSASAKATTLIPMNMNLLKLGNYVIAQTNKG